MSYLIPANPCPWLDFPGVGGVSVWTMSFCERVRRRSPLHSRSLFSSLWCTQNAISQSTWHLRSIAAFWSFSSLTRSLTSLWRRNNPIIAMHRKMLYIRTQGHYTVHVQASTENSSIDFRGPDIVRNPRQYLGFSSRNTGKFSSKNFYRSHCLGNRRKQAKATAFICAEQCNHSFNFLS